LPRFKTAKLSTRPLLVCALFDVEGIELTDPPCRPANLILALNNLVDALTGLERILTTPIPYSSVALYLRNRQILIVALRYSVHLWAVTLVYCFFLVRPDMNLRRPGLFTDICTQPFQLWPTLKFLTIPGTIMAVRAPFERGRLSRD
jgi:putative membrane protein